MDRTVKLLLDKVTQLTNRFNSLTQNSKKIHELGNAEFSGEVFIAVSNGNETGKTVYKPSEVSKEEFENIANMILGSDPVTSNIFLKDSEGNVITTLDVSFLNGNNVKLNIDPVTQSLQLLNLNDEVVSAVPLYELVSGGTTKNVSVSEEAQNIVPDANKNIVRFASLVTGTTIQPGINNGDQLLLINKSTAETTFEINIPVMLQTTANADVFSVQPNTNYLFWFEKSINRWIDVTI